MTDIITKKFGANSLTVFPAPTGADMNTRDFKVEMNVGDGWTQVPVYNAKVAYREDYVNYNCYRSSFASADIEGKIDVRVTSLSRNIDYAKIRPLSDEIRFTSDRNTILFSVDKPCQLSVEVNGHIYRNLQLFFNPPENDIPSPDDENVIYLGAGVHNAENCEHIVTMENKAPQLFVKEGQTLYLAGGCVLQAAVIVKGNNTKVIGRGIIDLLFTNAKDCSAYSLPDRQIYPQGIKIDHADNVYISGVIIRNPCSYCVSGAQCSNVTIDNIKTFACHSWSDGIDMMASHHITIKNSFVRSCDDSIAIYARRWDNIGDSYDWDITNCVLWSDIAHSINIATHGSQDENNRETIHDIRFKDIDILEVNCRSSAYWGAMAFTCGDENICRDFTFEDIRVDDFTCSDLFFVKVQKNGGFNPNPGYLIENITFKNITYNGANQNPSFISGYDKDRVVRNVTFDNVVINGKKILNAEEGNIQIGDFVENIVFK